MKITKPKGLEGETLRERILTLCKARSRTAEEIAVYCSMQLHRAKHEVNLLFSQSWLLEENGKYTALTKQERSNLLLDKGLANTNILKSKSKKKVAA